MHLERQPGGAWVNGGSLIETITFIHIWALWRSPAILFSFVIYFLFPSLSHLWDCQTPFFFSNLNNFSTSLCFASWLYFLGGWGDKHSTQRLWEQSVFPGGINSLVLTGGWVFSPPLSHHFSCLLMDLIERINDTFTDALAKGLVCSFSTPIQFTIASSPCSRSLLFKPPDEARSKYECRGRGKFLLCRQCHLITKPNFLSIWKYSWMPMKP